MPSKPSKHQIEVVKNIHARQKGWPVGIAVLERTAKGLIKKNLAEYAPPCIPMHLLNSRKKLFSVRCTTLGELYAKGVI